MIYNEIYHRFRFCATCLFYTSRVTSPAYDSGGTELDIFDTQGTLVQIKSCKSTINMLGKSTQSDLFTIMIIIITLRN